MNSVTNLNGKTFTVGQTVHYRGIPCEITSIRAVRRGVPHVHVKVSDVAKLDSVDYWQLNPQAAAHHGHPDFCRPRDHGLSMGCFDEA
jgi:hypothetical protein